MGTLDLEINAILDDLVHQFTDRLAFFRELIQNSIDAGSGEIEVELEFEQTGEGGLAVAVVRDWGKGMTRRIIEDELLRLFSSDKAADLTRVGRFGIGFVSVFAIEPEWVVVDTGRHGEYWRLLFSSDRTYELFERDRPIEGTRVEIRTPMDRDEYEEFRRETRRALVDWCKHAEIPVRLEGEDIRRGFEIDSEVTTTYRREGTRIVMGFVEEGDAHAGYYNRGLTLKESPESPWPWVSFKIDSRYLDHTLTRDRLLEDRHLSEATSLLEKLAEKKAPDQLIATMEELATDDESEDAYAACCRYLTHFMSYDKTFRRSWRERKIFRTLDAEPMSWRDVDRCLSDGRLHLTKCPEMPEDILGDEHRFLFDAGGLRSLFEQLIDQTGTEFFRTLLTGDSSREPPAYLEDTCLIPEIVSCDHACSDTLEETLRKLLESRGAESIELICASSNSLPEVLRNDLAVAVPAGRRAVPVDECHRPGFDKDAASDGDATILVVNGSHELVERADDLARQEPEWGALVVLESLSTRGQIDAAKAAACDRLARIRGGEP